MRSALVAERGPVRRAIRELEVGEAGVPHQRFDFRLGEAVLERGAEPIERVGAECEAYQIPFFCEFVGYDPQGGDEKGFEYAKKRPDVVIGSMKEFGQPQYNIDVLKVENSTVRRLQIDKLKRLRSERDQKEVDAALAALTRSAGEGNGNLLALAIDAARAKATVGEISDAMEKVFGRHRAEIRSITGVYKREVSAMSDKVERLQALIEQFEEAEGRRPRILVAKIGQDGHDRGQKVIASAFADVGFDVDIGPLFATADEAARQAVENDVHMLGVSSLAAAHLTAVPELKAALKKQGREDIMIIIGGVIPPQDYDALYKAGAEAIFPPGTVIADAAEELIHKLNVRLGHASAAAE